MFASVAGGLSRTLKGTKLHPVGHSRLDLYGMTSGQRGGLDELRSPLYARASCFVFNNCTTSSNNRGFDCLGLRSSVPVIAPNDVG